MNTFSMKRLVPAILFLLVAVGIQAAEPERLVLNTPLKLTGTIVREFDMSFVDSDLSPLQNPKEVARAVATARAKHPGGKSKPKDPIAHLILRLDQPLTTQSQPRKVTEIDLGGAPQNIQENDLWKTRFVVSGTLSRAKTVHHLRPIRMTVETIERHR